MERKKLGKAQEPSCVDNTGGWWQNEGNLGQQRLIWLYSFYASELMKQLSN